MRLKNYYCGKVFLVTGASSGIGEAVAKKILEYGGSVAAMARNENKLRNLEARDRDRVLVITGDVRKPLECTLAVTESIKRFGKLDGIIHSAGLSQRASARDSDPQVYETLMATNFFPLIHLYHAAIEELIRSEGHFIAISSMMGHYSSQLRSGYAASKHAVQGFMDAIRLEHIRAKERLHVLTVSPGFVRTNVSQNALCGDGRPFGVMTKNIGTGLDPLHVADAILKAIIQRKRDIFPSNFKEQLALYLSKWSPRLLDSLMAKQDVE